MTKTFYMLRQPFYWRLLIIAAGLHLCAAWFSVGHYHQDEYNQILEFAAYKAGTLPLELLTWEYHDQVRSAVQPFIVYGALQILPDSAGAPFLATFILRLLSVILALVASLVFFLAYQNDFKNEAVRRWVFAAMLLCWVFLFYHARFSSEGWAGTFLLLAFAFLRHNKFLLTGVFFGLAFAVRYQTGFMLLPLAFWVLFILRPKWQDIALLLTGGAAVLLVELLINGWFYDAPILPWVNYLQFHISQASPNYNATNDPALMYWTNGGTLLPPLGYLLPVVLAAFWAKFPRHPLVWATALYVVFHLWVDNRQLRFMYPVLIFMPYITAMIWQEVIAHKAALRRGFLWLLKISAAINMPLAAYAALHPAAIEIKLLRDCVLPNMQDGTSVYYLNEGGVDNIAKQFYLRQDTLTKVENEEELREQLALHGGEALYVSRKPRAARLEENGVRHTRFCSGFPEWVLRINVNNWTARASIYPVYRVSVDEGHK